MKRIGLIALAIIVLAIVGGVLWLTRERALALVHPTRGAITRLPESVGITGYQTITFTDSDGLTLKGWWVPPVNGATIIFVHGHGGNRQGLLDDAGILVRAGYGALLFDLRGNGESEGDLTTFGLLEADDVRAAFDFVTLQLGVDPNRVGLLGQSMGGATVLLAAAQLPQVKAVAALSAYTSMEDNIKNGVERLAGLPAFPFAPLVIFWGEQEAGMKIGQVRPVDAIAQISPRAVLLVHGDQDSLIPVENAYALYEAASEPKELYIVPGAGHQSFLPIAGQPYADKLTSFFDQYLLGQ
jgi:fermentation-respiration switch protein FrsA (DUF1100 family)